MLAELSSILERALLDAAGAMLRLLPRDVTVPPAFDAMLVRVPMDDTPALVLSRILVLIRELAVPLAPEPAARKFWLPPWDCGSAKDGIGWRACPATDFVEVMVPPLPLRGAFVGAFSLDNVFKLDETEGVRLCDAFLTAAAVASDVFLTDEAAADFDSAADLAATACGAFATGSPDVDVEAGFPAVALVPAPMFQTLRTSDFAELRNPNRDGLPLAMKSHE